MKPKNRNLNRYIRRHHAELVTFSQGKLVDMTKKEKQALVLKHRQERTKTGEDKKSGHG